ncbi:MAG: tetratricopeptide repeat protein [Acidobacteriota bacterium]
MPSLPARLTNPSPAHLFAQVLALILFSLFPAIIWAQGSGRAATGTGGAHVIQGHVFFPSGRRAEGTIQVKLQSFNSGELTAIADSSGSFLFTGLSPGNYTVEIIAGDDYEVARERVLIDSDVNLSRSGIPINTAARRYTVMITLQAKRTNYSKGSVINAALAQVPEPARRLYEKAIELIQVGDSLKAVDNLRAALSLYPKFPLALNELGVQYLKLGQPFKAVEPLRTAATLSPEAYTPKLNLGIALLESGQFAEAEIQLREVLKLNAVPTAHMYLGLTLVRLQRMGEAEEELKQAIQLGGNQLSLAHYYLGGIYWQRRDYQRAADELETYLRLSPNAPDAERVRGTIKELRSKT